MGNENQANTPKDTPLGMVWQELWTGEERGRKGGNLVRAELDW
jgi:hypothetical protein